MPQKIVVTGAAGLVGQNLVARLKNRPDYELIAIDKHTENINLFRQLHPDVRMIEADLAVEGDWAGAFTKASCVIINQAQIGGLHKDEFIANNVKATEHVLKVAKRAHVPYFVGISSSVVNSMADDFYTQTKSAQEKLFNESDIPHLILRPTLMFGWFDRKHLGWLRRFMDRVPVFPVPGDGKYVRQPLYVGDFVSVISSAIEKKQTGTFDISGLENVTYIDLIQTIHHVVEPRARIVNIPYGVFWLLLWFYAIFDRNPPFTTKQLEALVLPETFPVTDWPGVFDVKATPLLEALKETYLDTEYSDVVLQF